MTGTNALRPLEGFVPFPPEFGALYRSLGYWRDESIAQTFGKIFDRFADRPALFWENESITYREVRDRSERLAAGLWKLGLRPNDRLVLQMPNNPEFVYLYFALQRIGALPIMALPSHRYYEVKQFVEQAEAVACIGPANYGGFEFSDMYLRIASELQCLQHVIVWGDAPPLTTALSDLVGPFNPPPPPVEVDPAGPALFLLSGGTTGIPKLIPRTHNDYLYNSLIASEVNDIRAGDVLLGVLPIAHNLPLACPGLQGFLLQGASVALSPSTKPTETFPMIENLRITHLEVVPALLISWLNNAELSKYDVRSVRVIQSGGQRLQPEIRRLAEARFPNSTVQENFGMAEGMLMFVRLDDPPDVRLETVGRPLSPHDEVRLVDDDDNLVEPGEVGELLARGPYTLRGYFRAPDHNSKAFTNDGFYRSGDLMVLHPSGNYVVAGRKKDLINRGGEKISAEEVENLILAHPDVVNVACVPFPDPVLGERMCACLVLRESAELTKEDLVDFLGRFGIARHKLPERVMVLDSLPMSPFGKVSKKDLISIVSAAP